MEDILNLKVSYEDFKKIVSSPKIDYDTFYIYQEVLDSLHKGRIGNYLASRVALGKPLKKIVIEIEDLVEYYDDSIKIELTINQIKTILEKEKYSKGVRKPDISLYKKYLKEHVEETPKKEKVKRTKLKWIDEIRNTVSEDFINSIISKVPSDLDNLESIMYVYYELCKELSYDYRFFINREKDEERHIDYKNIPNINKDNNMVVCYEFNVILALIAEKYGFKASIADLIVTSERKEGIVSLDLNENIKNDHYSLVLSDKNHSIYFDSTRGSLDIDLVNVKTGRNINGIKSLDGEDDYISYKTEKVYDLFLKNNEVDKDKFNHPSIQIEKDFKRLEEALERIRKGETELVKIPLHEKIQTFLEATKNSTLTGMDEVSNLYSKFRSIFELDRNNSRFRIVKTKKENYMDEEPVVITMFNENGIKENNYFDDSEIYIYEKQKGFERISETDLLERLFNQEYVIIDPIYDIPGIKGR